MGKTNAQEREALRKIREILEGFDPEDTYIGKAFEGCVEQAEENICNDWMLSWKGRYLDEQLGNCRLSDKVEALTKTLNQKDDAIVRLMDAKKEYEKLIAQGCNETSKAQAEEAGARFELDKARTEIRKLQQTILELKAKLYDMMTGEEGEE